MFRIFWTDIDENGNNLTGSCDYWDPEDFRAWYRTKPSTMVIYRAQNMQPMREDIIRRQLIGAA